MHAPDLENGHILHGINSANAWVTDIQAVLLESGPDGDKAFHLAHECRKERLPLCNGPLGGGEDIFMRNSPHDFMTYTAGERFWQFPNPDTLITPQSMAGVKTVSFAGSLFLLPYTQDGWDARAHCPQVPVTPLAWEAVRDGLASGALAPRRLYCRFDWQEDGTDWQLCYPAHYVNFSNTAEAGAYLQPISGTVMIPFRGSFLPGYIACAVAPDGRVAAEFLVPRYVDVFTRLTELYRGVQTPLFSQLSQTTPALIRVFDWVRKCPGQLTFYTYRDKD